MRNGGRLLQVTAAAPEVDDTLTATWEIHAADAVLHATVTGGALTTAVGPAPTAPDLVVIIPTEQDEVPTFRDIIRSLTEGTATLEGRPDLRGFLHTFAPSAP